MWAEKIFNILMITELDITKLDLIKNQIGLAQKAFDNLSNENAIIVVRRILNRILKIIDE